MSHSQPSVFRNPHPPLNSVDISSFKYESYAWRDISVRLDASTGVLTVELNRPARHNAFTNDMCHSLVFAFELADLDARVRAVVFTGKGKSFCAGADLSEGFGADDHLPINAHRDGGGQVSGAVLRCRKPVVAAMNGNSVGVGITMALPADMRIVSRDAKLAVPFVKRGITMEAMSAYILPRLIGHKNALEVCLTGDTYLAADSPFNGLFNAILPTEAVLPRAVEIATKLAKQNSVVSMALNKSLIWRTPASPEETHLLDSACIAATSRSADAKEGVQSFLEKRKPKFTGAVQDMDHFGFYPWWRQVDTDTTSRKTRGSGNAKL